MEARSQSNAGTSPKHYPEHLRTEWLILVSDGTEAGSHMTRNANPGIGDGYIGVDEDY